MGPYSFLLTTYIVSMSVQIFVGKCYAAQSLKCFTCTGSGCGDPYPGNDDDQTNCTPDLATKAINSLKEAAGKLSSALESLGINTGSVDKPDVNFVCTKVEIKSGEKKLVTRGCGIASDKVNICESLKSEHTMCSTCERNLCNGATSTHMNLGLIAAAATLLAATYFR